MSDGPEWFAQSPGTYSAVPVTWQGWLLTLAHVAVVILCGIYLNDRPAALLAIVLPLTFLLVFIVIRTTRGGWRWRWRWGGRR